MTKKTSKRCAASWPTSRGSERLVRAGGFLLLVSILLGGCSVGRPWTPTAPAPGNGGLDPSQLSGVSQLMTETQSLWLLEVDSAEGDGVLSLTLRLAAADRFRLLGRDRVLRRAVWELGLEGDRALMIDHRRDSYCWYGPSVELEQVPLGPMPVSGLPALLFGRLPWEPMELRQRGAGEWSFVDRRGRRWRAEVDGDGLVAWTLFEGEEPAVWYRRGGDRVQRLSARGGLQLRWRQTLFEPLEQPLAALEPPAGYLPDCR